MDNYGLKKMHDQLAKDKKEIQKQMKNKIE
jgi:hypothetical protein